MNKMTLFWFRRDLRLFDNAGLFFALKESSHVQPIFIFDTTILESLEKTDLRVNFIHQQIIQMKKQLNDVGSDLRVLHGDPVEIFAKILKTETLEAIYTNRDDEPSALKRDEEVCRLAEKAGVAFKTFKDQSLFERDEILTDAQKPYTVFTPYKNKVLKTLNPSYLKSYPVADFAKNYVKILKKEIQPVIGLSELGFQEMKFEFPSTEVTVSCLKNYAKSRDFPADAGGTSHLGLHFRFGTVSIRQMARLGMEHSPIWLSELIWRDFFKQILWHHPRVVDQSYRPEYDKIAWRKSKKDFERWSTGQTGYPLVDAGMRELNATGHMHNRVRMVTASFLCKHLLIHWKEGERYFASKLLDYDLSANNGNWQWAAGSGCDAAPYFRIFNPEAQAKKFDPKGEYIKKWVPEYGTGKYPEPMVDHVEARGRCLQEFTKALKGTK